MKDYTVSQCLTSMKEAHAGTGSGFSYFKNQLTPQLQKDPSLVTDELINTLRGFALNHIHEDASTAEGIAGHAVTLLGTAARINPAKGPVIAAALEEIAVTSLRKVPKKADYSEYKKGFTAQDAAWGLGELLNIPGETQEVAFAAIERMAQHKDRRVRENAQTAIQTAIEARHYDLSQQGGKPVQADDHLDLLMSKDLPILMKQAEDPNYWIRNNALYTLVWDMDNCNFFERKGHLSALTTAFKKAVKATDPEMREKLTVALHTIEQRLKK